MFKSAAVRSLLLNTLIFLSLVVSHHLGGGTFLLTPAVVSIFAVSYLIFRFYPLKELEGPRLTAILVLYQLLGHMAAPVQKDVSENRMICSHFFAVLVTYILAKYFDAFIGTFDYILRKLLSPEVIGKLALNRSISLAALDNALLQALKSFHRPNFGRAPPAGACA
jgi:hypothetical protein